jgi:hypothetical protein
VAASSDGTTDRTETPHTLVYVQALKHPRLQWASRTLEIWKQEPRARLTFKLNRISSAAPEIFYITFPLLTEKRVPRVSSGGEPFTPFTDQLPGTCRDYFAIDGWAEYVLPEGRWLWVSRDAPLISFGSEPTLAALKEAPEDMHLLRAMVYNNFWYTNFLADQPGIMEFQFDLLWTQDAKADPAALASAVVADPILLINPAIQEDPLIIRHLQP